MTRYNVRVVSNAHKNMVELIDEKIKVRVTAAAIDGKANQAVIELLAKHFKIKKTSIKIIRGETSRDKIIELDI
jgi:uncharacterized protein